MQWPGVSILQDLFRPRSKRPVPRTRLQLDPGSQPLYAIGDVHGCLDALMALEAAILADARQFGGHPLLVLLGDMIDRGPCSAQVIEHLLADASQFDRICLAGNHEVAFGEFLDDPGRNAEWLGFGGLETLLSYGVSDLAIRRARARPRRFREVLEYHVPEEHSRFLQSLPILFQTPDYVFTHAGLKPGVALEEQDDLDLLWHQDNFSADYAEFGRVIIHGHTPIIRPLLTQYRICIDTGAYVTGRLTAVRLLAGDLPHLLAVGPGGD